MPQKRNVPSSDDGERIVRAVEGLAAAKVERDQAITDALKHGASVREVALVAGMSERSIQTIGHDNGWPTAAQQQRWADEKAERADFLGWVGRHTTNAEQPQPPRDTLPS